MDKNAQIVHDYHDEPVFRGVSPTVSGDAPLAISMFFRISISAFRPRRGSKTGR